MEFVDQIEGYPVLGVLGYGANSVIYSVQDPQSDQVYAMKRVVRRNSGDDRFVQQTLNEHKVSSRLDHPTLRMTHELIRRGGLLRVRSVLVLMEMVDGLTLEQQRPPSLFDLSDVFLHVAEGLLSMHQAGFVHADIKPQNILVTTEGLVKVIDFGQSCPIGTVKQRIQGTPDYIAPEQVRRGPITAQTDVFNLGAAMYWCVTGRFVPTVMPRSEHEVGLKMKSIDLIAPVDYNPNVPAAFNSLILNCLHDAPTSRPDSMKEVAARLRIVHHQLRSAPPEPNAATGAPIPARNTGSG